MSAVEEIDPATAHAIVEEDGAVLLDVRNPDEWDAAHVPTAVLIPLGDLADRYTELPADRRIAIICRSGARSARATEALVGAGYDAVNVAGGMIAWTAAGLPVVTEPPGVTRQ